MKCIVCGKEFESRRKDAQYCSSTCRSKKSRTATDNEPTQQIKTEKTTEKPLATDNAAQHICWAEQCSHQDTRKVTMRMSDGTKMKAYICTVHEEKLRGKEEACIMKGVIL